MTNSILDLPDDILVEFFSRYVSIKDLCRLEQVCRRFHSILHNYLSPWKNAISRLTNVSFSKLKNSIGCPVLQNVRPQPSIISHQFYIPTNYQYEVLSDHSEEHSHLLPIDYRRPLNRLESCAKFGCDTNRLVHNYSYLAFLASNWNQQHRYINNTIIEFRFRRRTSFIQYDEHNHQLWFNHDRVLSCLNIDTNQINYSYDFNYDDILCYKVYDDHLICSANGSRLQILSRQTHHNNQHIINQQDDILSLDVYSNDQERYLIVNGSRDHTVSMRIFNMSRQNNQFIWQTRVDDRVLCTRFTNDGQYFVVGTGGTASPYPLILFNIEKAQPIHFYNAQYRLGAGTRCIEWVSPNVFIAAGFDNQFKEFDLRTGICHYTFNDSFGNDYCSLAVSVDNNYLSNGIILGGNHHSTVRLVNRRQRQLQNVFFVSKQASPVHSLAVTSEYLFASVDRSIVALDFTESDRKLQQIHHRF